MIATPPPPLHLRRRLCVLPVAFAQLVRRRARYMQAPLRVLEKLGGTVAMNDVVGSAEERC